MLTLTNYSPNPYRGWFPATAVRADRFGASVQVLQNKTKDVKVVLGPVIGDGTNRVARVFAELDAQTNRAYPWESFHEFDNETSIPDADAELTKFGQPFVNGMPWQRVALVEERAGMVRAVYKTSLHLAPDQAIHLDLCLEFRPGTGIGAWEVTAVAGDIGCAAWVQRIPFPIRITFGKGGESKDQALIYVLGKGYGVPLLSTGETFGVGQGRAFCGHAIWIEQQMQDPASALAACERLVHAQGLTESDGTFGPLGVPAKGGPPAQLLLQRGIDEAMADLHNWTAHDTLGVVTDTRRTGAVEEQGWTQASEAFHHGGNGHQHLRYLLALSSWKRPIHYRGRTGEPLTDAEAEGFVPWDGLPDARFSPNMLGRVGNPPDAWAHGWKGPDRQHDFIHTLGAAATLCGSPWAVQQFLEDHARYYLWSDPVDPRIITSGPDAGRAAGWVGLKVAWLWRTLDDRELAQKVRDRFEARVKEVYTPHVGTNGIWDTHDDPRVWHDMGGKKDYAGAWMPYQQAVAAGGIRIAGEVLDIQEAKDLATRLADVVLTLGYTYPAEGDPIEWDFVAFRNVNQPLPDHEYRQGVGAHRTGWFADAWFPFAAWAALRNDPTHTLARRVYNACKRRMKADNVLREWLPPL